MTYFIVFSHVAPSYWLSTPFSTTAIEETPDGHYRRTGGATNKLYAFDRDSYDKSHLYCDLYRRYVVFVVVVVVVVVVVNVAVAGDDVGNFSAVMNELRRNRIRNCRQTGFDLSVAIQFILSTMRVNHRPSDSI